MCVCVSDRRIYYYDVRDKYDYDIAVFLRQIPRRSKKKSVEIGPLPFDTPPVDDSVLISSSSTRSRPGACTVYSYNGSSYNVPAS